MNCRLLYLIGQLERGGSERQLCYLLENLDRERYGPHVAIWNFRDGDTYVPQLRALGVPLHFLSQQRSRAAKLITLRRLVAALKPQVVHSYGFYTNFAAWFAACGSRTIPIGSIRQDFVTECCHAGKVLGRLSARWPATQICNSFAAIKTVEVSSNLFKPARLALVSNGMDIHRFEAHPLPQDKPSLLAVGRLAPEKRWDRLLKCVALAAAKGADFSLSLAGDGPLSEHLKQQAKALGIDRLVTFLGLRPDVASLFKSSTFLVHTADAEGCPNTVMEAMSCARAVVATDAGDIPYLVHNGKTGFVVPRGDDATFVERMVKLITDRDLCRRMGEAGRAKAEQEFGIDHLVEQTFDAYHAAGWKVERAAGLKSGNCVTWQKGH